MQRETCDRLIDALSLRGGGLAAVRGKEFYALLDELFTEEEGELASRMPLGLASAEDIAKAAGRATEDVAELLERMADKGLVISSDKGGIRRYNLPPLVPGIFEFQFMKGEVSDRTRRMARLFEDYFKATWKDQSARRGASLPFARVIPVEKEIAPGVNVYPYEQLSEYIKKTEHIAVSTCYCRHHGELLGRPCDKPKDVCLSFGPSAKFNAERGFGRLISKQEAMEILDRSEEAGLVHCSSNTSKYIDFICNCCICHCGILQTLKESRSHAFGAVSGFIVEVDGDRCVGCETCVGRCPMGALAMAGETVQRNASQCIGCGLCVSSCPSEALSLASREGGEPPPRDYKELMMRMMARTGGQRSTAPR